MDNLEEPRDDRAVSFWHDTVPGSLDPRPALQGDRDADVAIVGAGPGGLAAALALATCAAAVSSTMHAQTA